jgi:hypothetical protein
VNYLLSTRPIIDWINVLDSLALTSLVHHVLLSQNLFRLLFNSHHFVTNIRFVFVCTRARYSITDLSICRSFMPTTLSSITYGASLDQLLHGHLWIIESSQTQPVLFVCHKSTVVQTALLVMTENEKSQQSIVSWLEPHCFCRFRPRRLDLLARKC